MKKERESNRPKSNGGSRMIASLKEAVDWAEGKDVAVCVSRVEIPMIDGDWRDREKKEPSGTSPDGSKAF